MSKFRYVFVNFANWYVLTGSEEI